MCYDVHMSAPNLTPTDVSATLSLRLSANTKSKLATLARHTRRTSSFLANEAITAYVEYELAIIEGIERGLADIQAGRVTSHSDAMKKARETIAATRKGG